MRVLGDRPAQAVTTREIEQVLAAVARIGVSPSTVNRARSVISAAYSYGMRPSTFGFGGNPVKHSDRRSAPDPLHLAFYSPEQVEALAQAMTAGAHRDRVRVALAPDEVAARAAGDSQDAQIVRIAAYAGLRRGELVALRWRDVDLPARKLTVRRTVSGERELSSTKTRQSREVPIADQAEAAFSRLLRRGDFTGPDNYVFVNRYGRRLDPSALRRRYERARNTAGLEPLRFHDLRHTYGSLLVAGGIDLVSVKVAMGHARLSTTERHLHARPAADQAARFSRAFAGRES